MRRCRDRARLGAVRSRAQRASPRPLPAATMPDRRDRAPLGARPARRAIPTSRASCRCRACRCRRRVLVVVLRQMRVRRVAAEAELQHDHAGVAELVAQAHDGLGDHAEVLRDRPAAARARARRRGRAPRPARAASCPRPPSCAPAGTAQYGDEATEVIDARQVDELERAAEALDPPAVAVARSAASRRAGCPRAGPSTRRNRAARPRPRRSGRARGARRVDAAGARRRSARRR